MNKTPADKWGTPIVRDFSGVERLRKLRGVKTWEGFTESTKAIYLAVARCFPGVQVYACGSRVRGDYRNIDDDFTVNLARESAGMKLKQESDFDFFIYGQPEPVRPLPPNTEQVKCRVPENEFIPIPIFENGMELG